MLGGLKAHGALAIAADYGKPWYKARPTASQLAHGAEGCVVALRIEPKRNEQALLDASDIDAELTALQQLRWVPAEANTAAAAAES